MIGLLALFIGFVISIVLNVVLWWQKNNITNANINLTSTLNQKEQTLNNLMLSIESNKKNELQSFEENMLLKFSQLSVDLLDKATNKLQQTSTQSIQNVINPFKVEIETFKQKVDNAYNQENQQRLMLAGQIQNLVEANKTTNKIATDLSKALSGDKKVQGNWGEIQLKNILEQSGLQEGIDFALQYAVKNADSQQFFLDALIKLPEGKHIVIDSKLSLVNYQNYINAEDEEQKQEFLKYYLQDVEKQINGLGSKSYFKLVNSVDFVIMFMPIEAAYILAMQNNHNLHAKAWENKIIICNSANLFAMLKTIYFIIGLEKQNKNTLQIAEAGANLYDKFVLLLDEYDKLGKYLKQSSESYEKGYNHISTGRGNLVARVNKMKELGSLQTKKNISANYMANAHLIAEDSEVVNNNDNDNDNNNDNNSR